MSRVVLPVAPTLDGMTFEFEALPRLRQPLWGRLFESFHRYSLGAFALLFLIVGSSATQVAAAYESAHITLATTSSTQIHVPAQPLRGPNTAVIGAQLSQTLQHITTQPINLTISSKTVAVNPEMIKSWLQVVKNHDGATYIHVNEGAIGKSLTDIAAPFVKAPVNQVTTTRADGSTQILATGRNGTKLGNTDGLAQQIGQTLLTAKGFQLNLPIETLAFATVSPASFDKLIEVNVVSKQMWLYDHGQLYKTYPISAGAPVTPTPIGQFKIFSKLPVQDMKGFNANGTQYFQPHVRWISYFLPGGYAVHGNYWRPQSWFGNINSSHGCVSLPDAQAKEVYDWAPIGTTVITHY